MVNRCDNTATLIIDYGDFMTTWTEHIRAQQQQTYLKETLEYVEQRRALGINVYPPTEDTFKAFELTAFDETRVVIIGQDPYHGAGQAHGLSFSVKNGVKIPPSLVNIYKELATDIPDFEIPEHGNLTPWAKQGVLLLNTVLSVEEGQAHSHKHLGWETFTDTVVEALNERPSSVVFILWGAHDQKKGKSIDRTKHTVLSGPHPSPLSAHRGFLGCRHFSKANDALIALGESPIKWQI